MSSMFSALKACVRASLSLPDGQTQHSSSRASRHFSDHVVACLHPRASSEMSSLLSSSQQFEMLQDPPSTVAAAKHKFIGKEVWKYFAGFSQRFRGVVRDVAGTLVNAEGIEVAFHSASANVVADLGLLA